MNTFGARSCFHLLLFVCSYFPRAGTLRPQTLYDILGTTALLFVYLFCFYNRVVAVVCRPLCVSVFFFSFFSFRFFLLLLSSS